MDDDPYLIPRKKFLRDAGGKSEVWYFENVVREHVDPPLPKTVYQGRHAFIRSQDARAYFRALERKSGISVVGRPPKPKEDSSDPVAAE